jgi:hypothetical protein
MKIQNYPRIAPQPVQTLKIWGTIVAQQKSAIKYNDIPDLLPSPGRLLKFGEFWSSVVK